MGNAFNHKASSYHKGSSDTEDSTRNAKLNNCGGDGKFWVKNNRLSVISTSAGLPVNNHLDHVSDSNKSFSCANYSKYSNNRVDVIHVPPPHNSSNNNHNDQQHHCNIINNAIINHDDTFGNNPVDLTGRKDKKSITSSTMATPNSSKIPFNEAYNKRVKTLPEHRVRIKRPQNEDVDIVIKEFSMGIDPGPIQVDESSESIFRFKTPYFRGKATIEIPPLDFRETWIFGWIQACYDLKFVNTYGKYGYSQWSIPGLDGTLEKAISDSDGKKFPWYGIRPNEVLVIPFPSRKTQVRNISMSDNFYPHVTWDYPGDKFESAKLTKVCRDQKFFVWLVAMNITLRQIYVLKAAKWRMKVTVKLDPQRPLGSRTISVSGKLNPPQIFFADEKNLRHHVTKFIPVQVLSPPSANICQILTWVPKGCKNKQGIVVIPAKSSMLKPSSTENEKNSSGKNGHRDYNKKSNKNDLPEKSLAPLDENQFSKLSISKSSTNNYQHTQTTRSSITNNSNEDKQINTPQSTTIYSNTVQSLNRI